MANSPERFAFAPENVLTEFELRQALFKTPKGLMYRAVFTVLDETVYILRIRGYVDHINSTPITNVLSTIRELDPFTDTDDLVNVASVLPQSRWFTALYDKDEDGTTDEPGELTSIDHVLVSPNLAACITSV